MSVGARGGTRTAAGVHYGVPVGVVVFPATAVLVWFRPRRWTAVVALLVGLFIGIGAVATPNTSQNPSSPRVGIVPAMVLQTATLVGVVAVGLLAVATVSQGTRPQDSSWRSVAKVENPRRW